MRSSLLVCLNDMRRRLRDRSAIVVAIVAPLALSIVLGLAFHGGGGGHPRLVVSEPGAAQPANPAQASEVAAIRQIVGNETIVRFVPSPATVRAKVASGGADVGLILPAAVPAPAVAGQVPIVVARRDEPEGAAVAAALRQALTQRAGAPPVGVPPVSVRDDTTGGAQGLIGYFAPSMGVVFLFFVATMGARGILAEREAGTLARLRSMPVPPGQVVAGKVLGMLGLGLVSMLVLWAVTVHLFATTWGSPVAVLLTCLACALAMTGVGAVVTVFSRTAQQATGVSGIVGFVLGLLGGNFFPPGSLPPWLVTASKLTPNRWALQAFETLSLDRGGIAQVWRALVILVVMAVVAGAYAFQHVRRAELL
jgi:ABC-2 type transport system permease protein